MNMTTTPETNLDTRLAHLHSHGIVDMHYDLLMDLYERRHRTGIIGEELWPQVTAGGIGVIAAAIYLDGKYLPEMALRVALDQVARLHEEVAHDNRFVVCRNSHDIAQARAKHQVAFLITMEGVEPLGTDLDLLRVFYELGVRSIGLTHARRNMAANGGVFAPTGSSPEGLTAFGKAVVRKCEDLGILIDLAHLNPAGIEDVLAITTKPLCITHTNARRFFDIERNSTDDQMRAVAARGGVIGANAALVSPDKDTTTLDRYLDHIDYMVEVAGIDHVGIGFDFFEFIYNNMSEADKRSINQLTTVKFIPDLVHHGHAPNVTRKLIERGYSDDDIEKVLYRNWERLLSEVI